MPRSKKIWHLPIVTEKSDIYGKNVDDNNSSNKSRSYSSNDENHAGGIDDSDKEYIDESVKWKEFYDSNGNLHYQGETINNLANGAGT